MLPYKERKMSYASDFLRRLFVVDKRGFQIQIKVVQGERVGKVTLRTFGCYGSWDKRI